MTLSQAERESIAHAEAARRNGKGRSRASQRRRDSRARFCKQCRGDGNVRVYDSSSGVNPLGIKCWSLWRCTDCNGYGILPGGRS